jgi:hypothetical protein
MTVAVLVLLALVLNNLQQHSFRIAIHWQKKVRMATWILIPAVAVAGDSD